MGTVDVSFPNRLPNLRQVNLCCQGGSKSSQRGSVWQVGSQDGGMDGEAEVQLWLVCLVTYVQPVAFVPRKLSLIMTSDTVIQWRISGCSVINTLQSMTLLCSVVWNSSFQAVSKHILHIFSFLHFRSS